MVEYVNTYKLRKGADVAEFKRAVEVLVKENFVGRKGLMSFKLLVEGDTWMDCSRWETREDHAAFLKDAENPTESALAFYGFLNMVSCRSRVYDVEMEITPADMSY